MPMKNPPHPGQSVRYDCIEPLGLTITEAAEALGVTRQTLNNLVNGKRGIGGYGDPPRQGVWRRRRNVVATSDSLRPRAGPAARRRDQGQAGVATEVAGTAPVLSRYTINILCPYVLNRDMGRQVFAVGQARPKISQGRRLPQIYLMEHFVTLFRLQNPFHNGRLRDFDSSKNPNAQTQNIDFYASF